MHIEAKQQYCHHRRTNCENFLLPKSMHTFFFKHVKEQMANWKMFPIKHFITRREKKSVQSQPWKWSTLVIINVRHSPFTCVWHAFEEQIKHSSADSCLLQRCMTILRLRLICFSSLWTQRVALIAAFRTVLNSNSFAFECERQCLTRMTFYMSFSQLGFFRRLLGVPWAMSNWSHT